MIAILAVVLVVVIAAWVFLQRPEFGENPAGARLERIKASPNFRDGKFHNVSPTPDLTEGATYFGVMKEFLFGEKIRNKPLDSIPASRTDLLSLSRDENVLVWFGHSSYFMQLDGKTFLVDPVLSGSASPISFTTRSFPGSDIYQAEDLPAIDYVFITHDHWDHLDHETILKIKGNAGLFICGLGTGAHLESWGVLPEKIIEKDWRETIALADGFTVHTETARHFSGRGLRRNRSLWMSYVLETPSKRIYIGGDSGYDSHFSAIGERFQHFDLAILENGQYDKNWKYIHMMPEEVVQAAAELKSERFLAVHSAKFALGNHAWDEPLLRVSSLADKAGINLITPMIGQKVNLDDNVQRFTQWWKGIN